MVATLKDFYAKNPNPVLNVGKDGTVLYSNEASEPLLYEWGVKVGEKLPSSIGEIVQSVISRNNPEKLEVRVGNKAYLFVLHPLPEEERVNISGFNISNQKEPEEKPLESKEIHYEIFNLMEEAIQICEIVFNEKGQPIDNIILDVNAAYEKHSGLKREEVIGRRIKEVLPVIEQIWLDRYAEVVRTGRKMHFEEYNASVDKWFDVSASPIGGNRFIAIFRNITDRKLVEESEERLKALMNYNPSLVFMKDKYGRYVYLNNAYEKQFVHTKDWYGKTDFDFWPKKSAELFQENDSDVLKSGQTHQFLEDSTDLNGTRYCWLNYKFPFTDSKNETYLGGIGIDITDRVRAEEALQESESRLKMAQVSAGAGIWDWDISTGKLIWSDELFELFGLDPQKTNPSFDIWISLIHPDDKLIAESKVKRAIVNHTALDNEYRVVLPSGERRWINALGNTIYDSSRKPIFMSGICIDITKRKIAEESLKEAHETLEEKVKERTEELEKAYYLLKESEKSLAEAQEIAHIGNWNRDIVTGDVQWSDEVYRIFGFQPQQFGVTYNVFLSHVHPEDRDFVITAAKEVLNGKLFDIDYRIIRTDGAERIVNEVVKVIFDEENNPIRLNGTVQDITVRKKAEEFLTKIDIVRQQEIHHRIKNNLQVISSLLDLQAEKFRNREGIKDSEVLEAFRESQDRVISMALIHEELYKGGKIDTLNFSPYIKDLAENLFQTYRVENEDISLNMDLEENIFFDMDIAIPLGMIVNELVSNSLKHAFIGRDKGKIQIELYRDKNKEYNSEECMSTNFIITVLDDGVGIPENFDIETLDSLGFQLVISLVDQLDGEFELKRDNGTEFSVKFTVTEKE